MVYSTLLCLLALFSLALSQKNFYATDVSISSVPNMKGALSASIYYDSTAGMMKTIYDVGVTEIHNFTDRVVYKRCGATCEAESVNYGDFGFYTPFPGETAANTSVISCATGSTGSTFSRKSTNPNAVSLIAFDTQGKVCRAKLVNGKTFTFKTFGSGTTTWSTSGCPKKSCAQQLDMMLVMDESNSIDNTEWASMKNFVVNFTNAFTIGENAAKIGIVPFAATATVRYPYQNDQQSFRNTMNKLTRYYTLSSPSGTVTGTALDTTLSAYNKYARKGNVKHITVVITDGRCTCKENVITTAVAPLKTDSVGYVFAVGVKGADVAELNLIASGTNGTATINGINVQTSFFVSDFNKLESILNTLIAATCTDFAGNPCGSSCKGFCGCNQTCVCPDDCSGFTDTCNTGMCSKTANGAGCYASAKPDACDDNNACTNEYCTNDQCISSDVVCPDKPCYTKKCDPSNGCVYTPKVCVDSNPCTDEFCNVTTSKCDFTSRTRPCQACQAYNLTAATCSVGKSLCEKWDCVQTGSLANCTKISDLSCDDLNACTIDSCDPAKGCANILRTDCDDDDMCTVDSCDPLSGCVHTPFNVTDRCDDLNACTIDSCNSTTGCVHTEIVCNTTDPCRDSVCNPLSGCELQYKNCAEQPGIRERLGDCYAAFCNDGSGLVNVTDTDQLGCYLDLQPDSTVDDCGVCNGDGTTCGFPLTVAEVAGISAGLVGGVVAGAVAFAAVGAFGAKKGYDAYMRNKNNMSGAQANPMYNDNGRSGQNPMYEMS